MDMDDPILQRVRRKPKHVSGKFNTTDAGHTPHAASAASTTFLRHFNAHSITAASSRKENSELLRNMSPTSLSRYKSTMGITDEEWRHLKLGGGPVVSKGISGFANPAKARKNVAAFSIGRSPSNPINNNNR